jgi:MoaA/NifB/PqqE/SkfB family radical SAM enzyme
MSRWQVGRKRLALGWKAARCWFWPFFKARLRDGRFRPVLSFLFTNLTCNYRCYYCYGSHVPEDRGMTIETAKRSVDWLHSLGCRVLAFMGGEPLLRKPFILDVARYAHDRGFYVYLPTNGVLLDEAFVDAAAGASVDLFNLAVDCVDEKPGLPKALNRIRSQYEMLREKSTDGRFLVMFNVNITPRNVEDVKELTEIAYRDRINVDYHVVEAPLKEHAHFETAPREIGFVPDDYRAVDGLLDWLRDRFRRGYNMANSPQHFLTAKRFIRGEPIRWDCRAGVNTLVIRTDGRLTPCFEFFNDEDDWGVVGQPRFQPEQLEALKGRCNSRCMSTCNFTGAYYYSFLTIFDWVSKYLHIRR